MEAERIALSGKPATVILPGMCHVEARPITELEGVANRILPAKGRAPIEKYRPINPEYSAEVAKAYDPRSPAVKRAYDAMIWRGKVGGRASDLRGLLRPIQNSTDLSL